MFARCGTVTIRVCVVRTLLNHRSSTHVPVCYATPLQPGLGHASISCGGRVVSLFAPPAKSFLNFVHLAGSPQVVLGTVCFQRGRDLNLG